MTATEVWTEGGGRESVVINTSDLSTDFIATSIAAEHPEVASLMRWSQQIDNRKGGGLIERDKYVTPRGIFDQMRVAQQAADRDDVVSGVLETTEALAFNKMSVQSDDEDEENIWNQIIDDIDLDSRIREMWREMFTVSQCYVAVWWDLKDYKVKGRSKQGVQRKKTYNGLKVPVSLTLLDPLKIVPVGNFLFNQDQLAWMATREESFLYDNVLSGREEDATISRLFLGRYDVPEIEQQRLGIQGVGPAQLFLLNPDNVWRLTATRSQYKPFADIRLKSVFELLDLKQLLREVDRSLLLGASNYIVLIKKGSEHMPAKNTELAALSNSIRSLSRIPVIVGDHRLSIEIITPKLDMSLTPEKYNTIDSRITARLYQLFMTGNFASGAKGDDSIKLLRMVSRGLEGRRSQIKRAIERQILQKIYERNSQFIEEPSLEFHPKSIAIDFDPGLASFILDLLDRKHISRGTALEQIDLDEDEEARRKTREAEYEDQIFHSLTPLQDPEQQQGFQKDILNLQQDNSLETLQQQQDNSLETLQKQAQLAPKPATPSGGATTPSKAAPVKKKPANADPKSAGRSGGGNRKGGGSAPGTGQGEPKDPRRGAKN